MSPFTQSELDIAQAVLDVAISERERFGSEFGASSITRLSETIFSLWSCRLYTGSLDKAPKSLSLRKNPDTSFVVDHPVPLSYISKKLLSIGPVDYRKPYICNLLQQYGLLCQISTDEQKRLFNAGLADKMPNDWNGIDRYARYKKTGICMGEAGIFNKDKITIILGLPHQRFYIYRLWTPSNKIFYIGKGDKLRALSHEVEIFKPHFKTHTNWKKLNKIAQILIREGEIGYEIESWHQEEIQAFFREDELILAAERSNPQILCNSNGRRWAGKPSQQLLALRLKRGIPT